ncbi:PAS domain S-box protein [Desulfomarina profundi]|uniref:PAS domain S-box protein n=1 Tax=Desulfomarina profundi TaxID=2772557 RepID=UPI001E3241A2|nr:PAS domain S-box protein [Desulfomarina profundi]
MKKRNGELEQQLFDMKMFKQAFFHSHDGMAIADDKGTLLEVNHALCETFGYRREELLGNPCLRFRDPAKNEEFQRRYALLFQQGYLTVETQYLHKDGREIPVELNASVFRYDDRYLVQISIRDISCRREKESLLKRQQEICSATDDLMSFVDRDYVYRFVNRAYLDTFNVSQQEILGRRVDDLLGTEIFEAQVRKRLDQCFSGETVRFQGRFSFSDPERGRFLDVTFYPYREPDGMLSGAIVVIHDVTDIKLVERRKVQEGKRYQHILSNVSDGVFIVDGEYNIIHANATLQKDFGKVHSGQKCYEYLNGELTPCFWCNNIHVLRGNTVRWRMNVVGKNRVYEVYETPFELSEGQAIKVSFFREITEQYLIEKKLAEKNKQLAEKNVELENINIALNVLLNKTRNDRQGAYRKNLVRLKKLVLPYLDLLGECTVEDTGLEYITIIKSHINSFSDSRNELPGYSDFGLTRREILVADLIRNGKKSKEIASLLGLSPRSIEAYRNSLRKKLHLTGKKISLKHYLTSTFSIEN